MYRLGWVEVTRKGAPGYHYVFANAAGKEPDVKFVQGLECVCCGTTYPARLSYTCPRCGISGILDVKYDYPAIARALTRRRLAARSDASHWRYRELLPIREDAALPALA